MIHTRVHVDLLQGSIRVLEEMLRKDKTFSVRKKSMERNMKYVFKHGMDGIPRYIFYDKRGLAFINPGSEKVKGV